MMPDSLDDNVASWLYGCILAAALHAVRQATARMRLVGASQLRQNVSYQPKAIIHPGPTVAVIVLLIKVSR